MPNIFPPHLLLVFSRFQFIKWPHHRSWFHFFSLHLLDSLSSTFFEGQIDHGRSRHPVASALTTSETEASSENLIEKDIVDIILHSSSLLYPDNCPSQTQRNTEALPDINNSVIQTKYSPRFHQSTSCQMIGKEQKMRLDLHHNLLP